MAEKTSAAGYTGSTLPAGVTSITTSSGNVISSSGSSGGGGTSSPPTTAEQIKRGEAVDSRIISVTTAKGETLVNPNRDAEAQQARQQYAMAQAAGTERLIGSASRPEAPPAKTTAPDGSYGVQRFTGPPTTTRAELSRSLYQTYLGLGFAPDKLSPAWQEMVDREVTASQKRGYVILGEEGPTATLTLSRQTPRGGRTPSGSTPSVGPAPTVSGVRKIIVTPTSVGFRTTQKEMDLGKYEVEITSGAITERQDIDETLGVKDAQDFIKRSEAGSGQYYDIEESALAIMAEDKGFVIKERSDGRIVLEKNLKATETQTTTWGPEPEAPEMSDFAKFALALEGVSAAPGSSAMGKVDIRYYDVTGGEAANLSPVFSGQKYVGRVSPTTGEIRGVEVRELELMGAQNVLARERIGELGRNIEAARNLPIIKEYRKGAEDFGNFIQSGGQGYWGSLGAKGGAEVIRLGASLPVLIAADIPAALFTAAKPPKVTFKNGKYVSEGSFGGAEVAAIGTIAAISAQRAAEDPFGTAKGVAFGSAVFIATLPLMEAQVGSFLTAAGRVRYGIAGIEASTLRIAEAPGITAEAQAFRGPIRFEVKGANIAADWSPNIEKVSPFLREQLSAESGQAYGATTYITATGRKVSVFAPDLEYAVGAGTRSSVGVVKITDIEAVVGGSKTALRLEPVADAGTFTTSGIVSGRVYVSSGGRTSEAFLLEPYYAREIIPKTVTFGAGKAPIGGISLRGIPSVSEQMGYSIKIPDLGLRSGERFLEGFSVSKGGATPFVQTISSVPTTTGQLMRRLALEQEGMIFRDYATTVTFGRARGLGPSTLMPRLKGGIKDIIPGTYFGVRPIKAGAIDFSGARGGSAVLSGGSGTASVAQIQRMSQVTTGAVGVSFRAQAQKFIMQEIQMPKFGFKMSVMGAGGARAGTISIQRMMPASIPMQRPSVSVRSVQQVSRVAAQTRLRIPGTSMRPMTGELTGFMGMEEVRTATRTNVRLDIQQLQRTALRTELTQRTPELLPIPVFTPPRIPRTPIGGGFPMPSFGGGGERRGFSFGRGRSYTYAPSLIALVERVRGRQPKILTGLEIRPISVGSFGFGAPARSRRRKRRR